MDEFREETPEYFICPISLQIMEDPVTLCTGMTYDRKSIENWFSVYNRHTCPITNISIADNPNLIPNLTLKRLIHAWKAAKSTSAGKLVVADVFLGLRQPHLRMKTLGRIKDMMTVDSAIRICLDKSGITALVASLAIRSSPLTAATTLIDEATVVLRLMDPSPTTLKKLSEFKDGELIGSLSTTMERGRYKARVDAAFLIKSALKVVEDCYKLNPPPNLIDGSIDILKDQNSDKTTTRAALSILMQLAQFGRNRRKAVESGAVAVMIELLVEEVVDRRKCEAMLALLCMLCGRAEGRAALLEHPAGVAAVVGKILKVSHTATEMAVKVMMLLCKYCGRMAAEEIMMVGGVGKLYTVLQVDRGGKSGGMAREILGLHLRYWAKFPCFPNCII